MLCLRQMYQVNLFLNARLQVDNICSYLPENDCINEIYLACKIYSNLNQCFFVTNLHKLREVYFEVPQRTTL